MKLNVWTIWNIGFWHCEYKIQLFLFCRILPDDIKPYTQQLLTNLFGAFEHDGSAENEYIMKGKKECCDVNREPPVKVKRSIACGITVQRN